ncbi:MAG: hypothetical protein V1749_10070 [Candidatus Desantisbacteria bacterium]
MKMKRLLIGLMAVAMMIGLPVIGQAMPGANVLISVIGNGGKVIEVDPITNSIVWEYAGTGTALYPIKAIPLTNGNIIIAENQRIMEVNRTKQIVWQWNNNNDTSFYPRDVEKTPRGTLLITGSANNVSKVMETTYPPSFVFWDSSALSLSDPTAAERLPDSGTGTFPGTYLIAQRGTWDNNNTNIGSKVSLLQSNGTTLWEYTGVNFPVHATLLADNSILIADMGNNRAIKVDYDTKAIIWSYGMPQIVKAIQIENGNFLIVAGSRTVEINPIDDSIVWEYSDANSYFSDVEIKGIINMAKISYRVPSTEGVYGSQTYTIFAGVVVPIGTPTIIGSPLIVAKKTVSPTGPQGAGTVLTYQISCKNTGNDTAVDVQIIDQVPLPETQFVIDSAKIVTGGIMPIQYSHDGGNTYDTSQSLPITHIKWAVDPIVPGAESVVEFKARIVVQP